MHTHGEATTCVMFKADVDTLLYSSFACMGAVQGPCASCTVSRTPCHTMAFVEKAFGACVCAGALVYEYAPLRQGHRKRALYIDIYS